MAPVLISVIPTIMPNQTILVLGVSGMAGHMVAGHLADLGHRVTGISRTPPVLSGIETSPLDLSLPGSIEGLADLRGYDAIVNCVGILPREAESDPATAIRLNAYLPRFIERAFRDSATRFIHVSTDCVFSGRTGGYREGDFRDGDTPYDRSKALGEFDSKKDLVFRQSIIGPEIRPQGSGLLHWFLGQHGTVGGYTNAIWNGITTLTLAQAIAQALLGGPTGIYQLVSPPAPLSKHELLHLFNDTFGRGVTITRSALPERVDKSLVDTRTDFPFVVPDLPTQMRTLRDHMLARPERYGHYRLTAAPGARPA